MIFLLYNIRNYVIVDARNCEGNAVYYNDLNYLQ